MDESLRRCRESFCRVEAERSERGKTTGERSAQKIREGGRGR